MTSNLPHFPTAFSTIPFTSPSTLTSHFTASAPQFGNWELMYSAALSAEGRLMSARRTWAPSEANWKEVSRPIPLESQRG